MLKFYLNQTTMQRDEKNPFVTVFYKWGNEGLKDFLISKVKPSSLDITEDDQMNLSNGLLRTDGNSQRRRRKNSYEKC